MKTIFSFSLNNEGARPTMMAEDIGIMWGFLYAVATYIGTSFESDHRSDSIQIIVWEVENGLALAVSFFLCRSVWCVVETPDGTKQQNALSRVEGLSVKDLIVDIHERQAFFRGMSSDVSLVSTEIAERLGLERCVARNA